MFITEHLELLEKGELKSLYDTEQGLEEDEDDDDMDTNEEDTEDEPTGCDDDAVDERLSESEDQDTKTTENEAEQYPVLNIVDANDLPEFNIEVLPSAKFICCN